MERVKSGTSGGAASNSAKRRAKSRPRSASATRQKKPEDAAESTTSTNGNTVIAEIKSIGFTDLAPKLQQEILARLDFRNLLKCRLLSKSLKGHVEEMVTRSSVLKNYRIHTWNPYFTVRPYYDLDVSNVLGLIRLESAGHVKRFVEENTRAEAKGVESTASRFKRKESLSGASSSTKQPRTFWKPAGGKPNLSLIPTISSARKSVINNSQSVKLGLKQRSSGSLLSNSTLFPHGAVHIRRRLQDYVEESEKTSSPAADTTAEVILWTNHLVRKFGTQLTSFTYDDGKRKGSDLSFKQLSFILSQLPNLVNLGISSGNYEHYSFEENLGENGEVEKFPPHANLKYVWLGYNVTYHLHMDILNAYGSQLKRLICSKFGVALMSPQGGDVILTTNSLQKLLDYVYSIRNLHPNMLSSLEELKIPVISTQNLMQEIESGSADPIRWSNLKRLSLHYSYRTENHKRSDFVDVLSFLTILAPTLEELYLNFDLCSEFIEWLSEDTSPMKRNVYRPCIKLRKLCISACSLLRFSFVAKMVSLKFPKLEVLTFFNWWMYYTEASQNEFQGKYFSGGPKTVADINKCIVPFWKATPTLDRVSVRIGTWKGESIYSKTRKEIIVPSPRFK